MSPARVLRRWRCRRWRDRVRADQVAGRHPRRPVAFLTRDHLGRIRLMCGRLQPPAGATTPDPAPAGHHPASPR